MSVTFRQAAFTLCFAFFLLLPALPAHGAAKSEAERLWEQGQAEYEKGRYDQALRYYESALAASRRANDLDGAGSTLYSIALAYEGLKRDDRALASYEASLAIYRQLKSLPDMAVNLLNMGALEYRTFARYDAALSHLQEALKIFRQINEEEFGALAAYHLGTLHVNTGQYRAALGYFDDSLRTNRKLKSAEGTASVLLNMGRACAGLGELQRAISLYEEAAAIDRRLNRFDDLAADLTHLGFAYNDLYVYDKALDYYRQALDLARSRNLPGRAATAQNNLGTLYFDLGRYETALAAYQEALNINRELSRDAEVAVTLNNIGNLYAALGLDEKALPSFKDALAINRARQRPAETAVNLNNIGMNYYRTGRYGRALEYLGEALKIRKQLGNPHEIARVLDNIGAVYLFQKRYREAETTFLERKALQANIQGIRLNYSGLVETCIATGRYSEARAYLKDMPAPGTRQRDAYRIDYHSQLVRIYKGEKRYAEASAELLSAVLIIEEMRQTAGEKGGFLGGGSAGGRARAYRALVESLAERAIAGDTADSRFSAFGRDTAAAAFYFAEATKARTLLEALASSSKKQGAARLPAHLKEKEAALLSRLDELDKRWEAAYRQGGAVLDELIRDKAQLATRMTSFAAELRTDAPLYAALYYPRPMAPESLSLKPDEVLLEYALGETAGYVFVVQKDGISRVIRIPEGREALEARVRRLLESLSENSGAGFSHQSARELFDLLLSKALAPVPDGAKVIVVPDGMLGLLPFEALVAAEGAPAVYAADRWNFTYTQSAAILGLTRMLPAPRASRALFALGNPIYAKDDPRYAARLSGAAPLLASADASRYGYRGVTVMPREDSNRDDWQEVYFPPLPETEDEVRAIAAILGVEAAAPDVLLGIDASETRLRTAPLGDYRMLHFATHADLPGKIQGLREPFLLLGQVENRGRDDGFLTLSEVLDLALQADQVVLSACVTGKGDVMEGEGVGSLARAFIHAGARSVVVSLWNLASVEAVEYMTRYYDYLKAGKGRADALRAARRDMKAKYPSPFYWAVFVLHGEG
ncbi:MAG: CHAT domain-containing tetratricopeptide repeat protein [Thermodesulfobacteriota bacterium]